MDLGLISNTLRGLRERAAQLTGEALDEVQSQISEVYRVFGYSASLVRGRAGILIGAIQTNLLEIIGDAGLVHLRLQPEPIVDDDISIELSQGKIRDINRVFGDPAHVLTVNPYQLLLDQENPARSFIVIDVTDVAPDEFDVSLFLLSPAGGSLVQVATLLDVSTQLRFDLNSIRQVVNAEISRQRVTAPNTVEREVELLADETADLAKATIFRDTRSITLVASATAVSITITDGAKSTVADHQSVVTPRARVGSGAAPTTDGDLRVDNVLKLAALAGAGLPLFPDAVGDVVAQAINLATAQVSGLLALNKGGSGSGTAAGARTAFDVYSKGEADTLLAAKAPQATTYTKTEVDGFVTTLQTYINTLFADKADKGVQTSTDSGHSHTQN